MAWIVLYSLAKKAIKPEQGRNTAMKSEWMIWAATVALSGVLGGMGCGPETTGENDGSGGSGTGWTPNDDPPKASCKDGELQCGGADTLEECQNDEWISHSCTEVCEVGAGFTSEGCSKVENICECGEPLDENCATGAVAYCICKEAAGNGPCTNDDLATLYFGCYNADPDLYFVSCLALFVDGNQVDCDGAASVCF